MFVFSISHEALSHPIELESDIPRSEKVMIWTAVQWLEANHGNLGWDWVLEIPNMTVTVSEV